MMCGDCATHSPHRGKLCSALALRRKRMIPRIRARYATAARTCASSSTAASVVAHEHMKRTDPSRNR